MTSYTVSKHTLVAVLRGITADKIEKVADILMENGFRYIEVPLNSPEPFTTIERLIKHCPEGYMLGAGTVTSVDEVQHLADIGANLVVSPHVDCEVIKATVQQGMCSIPGFFTVTEALQALECGAAALKYFPAIGQHKLLKNILSVLPVNTAVLPVGSMDPNTMIDFKGLAIRGFGFGGSLFKPDYTFDDIAQRAKAIQQAYQEHFNHEGD